jgi:voltage-gated potassium channel
MIAFLVLFVSLGRLYREMFRQAETRALLLLAALILVIGVVFYTRVEHWSLLNATYFCVITLGTVGYGDITPTTDLGKAFTTLYVIVGLSVIGGFLAAMGRMIRPGQLLAREQSSLARERSRPARQPHADDAEQTGTDATVQ